MLWNKPANTNKTDSLFKDLKKSTKKNICWFCWDFLGAARFIAAVYVCNNYQIERNKVLLSLLMFLDFSGS